MQRQSAKHSKKLLVEGAQDKRVIPELIEKNGIQWEFSKNSPIVHIQEWGDNNFIKDKIIQVELKSSDLQALGLIVDADDDVSARWDSVKNALNSHVVDLPASMPAEGLVCTTDQGIKVGVWIMPDNRERGMLETFLAYLVPEERSPIYDWAKDAAHEAKIKGAEFIDAHLDKAYIYTWLAWQNPPGRQLHAAIRDKVLQPDHPNAQNFVGWFKRLYDV